MIFDSEIIEILIITIQSKDFIRLFIEKNRNSNRRLGSLDRPDFQIELDINL